VPSQVRKQVFEARRAREIATPDDNDAIVGELEASEPFWKDKLLDVLRGLRPGAFERLAQRLLREAGAQTA
jgi:restriction system protein